MSNAVNTSQVQRRTLRFETLDQALAEARRIAQLAREGKAEYAGNWDAGQILNHLGVWAEFAYGGNPTKVSFPLRLLGPLLRNHFLRKGLPAGHSIPGVPNGTHGTEQMPVDQALARMTAAFTRLKTETPPGRHPLFGKMSHEQYIALNLRHAELHMSFEKN